MHGTPFEAPCPRAWQGLCERPQPLFRWHDLAAPAVAQSPRRRREAEPVMLVHPSPCNTQQWALLSALPRCQPRNCARSLAPASTLQMEKARHSQVGGAGCHLMCPWQRQDLNQIP